MLKLDVSALPRASVWLLLAAVSPTVSSQIVAPPTIDFNSTSPLFQTCTQQLNVGVALPNCSTKDKVDVFLLFDDTGSFQNLVPEVANIFKDIVNGLTTAAKCVDFGFGVGRFEDYGGPGRRFGGSNLNNRPFVLNQPIVDTATAGSQENLEALINTALNRTSPGNGGDAPETPIAEGLWQTATGIGFDGNGDGSDLGFDGTQVAGAVSTQVDPDFSGDVPPFSSLAPGVLASGTIGGAGYREDALKLVLVATDVCGVAAFNGSSVPATISTVYSTESTSDLVCSSTPGTLRFGFVSNAISNELNTVPGAVVPVGAGTVPGTVQALVDQGIRVIGLARNGDAVPPGTGPSQQPNVFLSALARLTGSVDNEGNPLVFQINPENLPRIVASIVSGVNSSIFRPVDIALNVSDCNRGEGLSVNTTDIVQTVDPGDAANFTLQFSVSTTEAVDTQCTLVFTDASSGLELATLLVTARGGPCGTTLSPIPPLTSTPSVKPSPQPVRVRTPRPSSPPTGTPSRQPVLTPGPTPLPTRSPTAMPNPLPTTMPSRQPVRVRTPRPNKPTDMPTNFPIIIRTPYPSRQPVMPTNYPIVITTPYPSRQPIRTLPPIPPISAPTLYPTALPTQSPTSVPTSRPTTSPSARPTSVPTSHPTTSPTASPSTEPTSQPTIRKRTAYPTFKRTAAPAPEMKPISTPFPTHMSYHLMDETQQKDFNELIWQWNP